MGYHRHTTVTQHHTLSHTHTHTHTHTPLQIILFPCLLGKLQQRTDWNFEVHWVFVFRFITTSPSSFSNSTKSPEGKLKANSKYRDFRRTFLDSSFLNEIVFHLLSKSSK